MYASQMNKRTEDEFQTCPICGTVVTPYGCPQCEELEPEPTAATYDHAFPVGDKVLCFYRWTCEECGEEHLTTLGVTKCGECSINVILEEV